MESSSKLLAAVRQRGAAPSSSDGEMANPSIRGQYSEKTVAQTSVKVCPNRSKKESPNEFALTLVRESSASPRFSSSPSRTCRAGRVPLASNLGAVLANGGPQSLVWGILIVVPGALAQAGSLAEMAAMQPIAGAQYHWIDHLAPPKYRRLITWMQGELAAYRLTLRCK